MGHQHVSLRNIWSIPQEVSRYVGRNNRSPRTKMKRVLLAFPAALSDPVIDWDRLFRLTNRIAFFFLQPFEDCHIPKPTQSQNMMLRLYLHSVYKSLAKFSLRVRV